MAVGPQVVQNGLKVQVDFMDPRTYSTELSTPIALDSTTDILNTAPTDFGRILGNASPQSSFTYYSVYRKPNGNLDGEAGNDVYQQSSDTPIVTTTNAGGTTSDTNFGTRKITSVANGSPGVNAFANGWESMIIGNDYYLEHTSTQYSGFFKYIGRDPVIWDPGNVYELLGVLTPSDTTIFLSTPSAFALFPGDILQVNSEKIRVESWSNALGNGDVWNVTRGVEGTAITGHSQGVLADRVKSTYLYKHYFEWVASPNTFQRAQRLEFSALPVNNSVNIYPAEKVGKWGYEGYCIANEFNWSGGDPSQGWVNINHNQNYSVDTDPFTIEVWFRMRDLPTAEYGHNTPIYGSRQGSDYALFCYPKELTNKSSMGACYDDSRYAISHKSQYQIGQMEWVQFVHTHTPYSGIRGQFEYYVNGELDTPLTISADTSGFLVPNTLAIGRDFRNSVQSRIDMAIIRHYDRVLTPAEVKQNFNANRGRFGL
jgi:hypothetical protein